VFRALGFERRTSRHRRLRRANVLLLGERKQQFTVRNPPPSVLRVMFWEFSRVAMAESNWSSRGKRSPWKAAGSLIYEQKEGRADSDDGKIAKHVMRCKLTVLTPFRPTTHWFGRRCRNCRLPGAILNELGIQRFACSRTIRKTPRVDKAGVIVAGADYSEARPILTQSTI